MKLTVFVATVTVAREFLHIFFSFSDEKNGFRDIC